MISQLEVTGRAWRNTTVDLQEVNADAQGLSCQICQASICFKTESKPFLHSASRSPYASKQVTLMIVNKASLSLLVNILTTVWWRQPAYYAQTGQYVPIWYNE